MAGKRPLPCMDAVVFFEVAAVGEGGGTAIAVEGTRLVLFVGLLFAGPRRSRRCGFNLSKVVVVVVVVGRVRARGVGGGVGVGVGVVD